MNFSTALLATSISLAVAGCGGGGDETVDAAKTALSIKVTGLTDGAVIPRSLTCYNDPNEIEVPEVTWSDVPAGTKSLIVVMDDVDAQRHNNNFTSVHYYYEINEANLADGKVAKNMYLRQNFPTFNDNPNLVVMNGAPCNPDPQAHTHSYVWKAYALDSLPREISQAASQLKKIDDVIAAAKNSNDPNATFSYLKDSNTREPYITRAIAEQIFDGHILSSATFTGTMQGTY